MDLRETWDAREIRLFPVGSERRVRGRWLYLALHSRVQGAPAVGVGSPFPSVGDPVHLLALPQGPRAGIRSRAGMRGAGRNLWPELLRATLRPTQAVRTSRRRGTASHPDGLEGF